MNNISPFFLNNSVKIADIAEQNRDIILCLLKIVLSILKVFMNELRDKKGKNVLNVIRFILKCLLIEEFGFLFNKISFIDGEVKDNKNNNTYNLKNVFLWQFSHTRSIKVKSNRNTHEEKHYNHIKINKHCNKNTQ